MPKNTKTNLVMPTFEQLCILPKEVLWLEIAELAEHSVPLVAQRAEAILADRSVPPTIQEVHELWQLHHSLTSGSATIGNITEKLLEVATA
jgi:hypothetical protein